MPNDDAITRHPRYKFRGYHFTIRKRPVDALIEVRNPDSAPSVLAAYNGTRKNLQGLIGEAVRQGKSVRAFGSAWSFPPVMYTSGFLIDTKPLNDYFELNWSNLDSGTRYSAENLLLAQAGLSIKGLNQILEAKQKSIPTSGASNGQTVVGAVNSAPVADDGSYTLAFLAEGTYDLVAAQYDSKGEYVAGSGEAVDKEDVDVSAGETTSGVEFVEE